MRNLIDKFRPELPSALVHRTLIGRATILNPFEADALKLIWDRTYWKVTMQQTTLSVFAVHHALERECQD